jgi:hypothetical protein
VDVGVRLQRLSPGMQDAQEAGLRAEAFGIGGNLQQRIGAGVEQEPKEDSLVLPDERNQRMGHAEDQVVIVGQQQLLLAGCQPFITSVGPALWAVAVAARVIRDGLMAAAFASVAVFAERGCATALDGSEHFQLWP